MDKMLNGIGQKILGNEKYGYVVKQTEIINIFDILTNKKRIDEYNKKILFRCS